LHTINLTHLHLPLAISDDPFSSAGTTGSPKTACANSPTTTVNSLPIYAAKLPPQPNPNSHPKPSQNPGEAVKVQKSDPVEDLKNAILPCPLARIEERSGLVIMT
jgi:hypothetical protein